MASYLETSIDQHQLTIKPIKPRGGGGGGGGRGLIEIGGYLRDGGLFNVEKTMVSLLHKELEYKVEKLKYKRLEVMQPRIRIKSALPVGK